MSCDTPEDRARRRQSPDLRAAFNAPLFEFEPKKARFIDGAGKGQAQAYGGGKIRTARNRARRRQAGWLCARRSPGTEQSFPHQPAAKPARTIGFGDRERAQAEVRAPRRRKIVPQPQGADELARILRRERKTLRGQAAFAQTLHGLLKTRSAERRIEQAFACPRNRPAIRRRS